MNKNKKRFNNISKEYLNSKEYRVGEETTLLSFLLNTIKGQSRNAIKGMLSHHLIAVNGSPTSQFDYTLYKGDTVLVSKAPLKKRNAVKLDIIYEDDDIIVINKPTKLLTVASDKEKGRTAYREVSDYVQIKNPRNRVLVVHRIDEDTSGVLMFAKNLKTQKLYQDKWNELVVLRGYYAICDGVFKEKKKTITSYLKSNSLNLMYSSDDKVHGKKAITHYEVLKENENYSFLDVHIDSGRKNQIRVHLGDLGHHIIGDDKYGNPTNPINRLGLHAYCLKIHHPVTNKIMTFKAKTPKEFEKLFTK